MVKLLAFFAVVVQMHRVNVQTARRRLLVRHNGSVPQECLESRYVKRLHCFLNSGKDAIVVQIVVDRFKRTKVA